MSVDNEWDIGQQPEHRLRAADFLREIDKVKPNYPNLTIEGRDETEGAQHMYDWAAKKAAEDEDTEWELRFRSKAHSAEISTAARAITIVRIEGNDQNLIRAAADEIDKIGLQMGSTKNDSWGTLVDIHELGVTDLRLPRWSLGLRHDFEARDLEE